MFTMIGGWMDRYAGKSGYNMMLVYAAVMAAGCMILPLLLAGIVRKDTKKR